MRYFELEDYFVLKDKGGYYVADTDGIAESEKCGMIHDHIDRYSKLKDAKNACREAYVYAWTGGPS